MAEPDFTFTVDVLGWDPESRRIWGRASAPVPDGENEIIEAPALAEALPDFLALPVLMWDHTDRPVGLAPKAWFEGDQFYIDGNLKPTSDCDDLAARLEAGEKFQFSIGGKRRAGSPSCRLRPEARREPCRTTALDLYSISLCPRGTAQNPTTFCEIRKALAPETLMPDEDMVMNPPEEAPAVEEAPAAAPEGQIVLTEEAVALIVKLVKDALAAGGDAGEIAKADDEECGDEPKDDDGLQKALKAMDARHKSELDAIKKSHTDEMAKLRTEMETIRKAKVPKIGVLDLEEARKANHQPGNAAVIGALLGGR
jgi:hypothetical protein